MKVGLPDKIVSPTTKRLVCLTQCEDKQNSILCVIEQSEEANKQIKHYFVGCNVYERLPVLILNLCDFDGFRIP